MKQTFFLFTFLSLFVLAFGTVRAEYPPSTPTLISPGSSSSPGPEISDMTPTLRWNSVAGATSYNFGVRDVDTGSLVVDVDGYTSTSYTTSSLTAGHKYRWNVQACNSAGCSSYSSYYYFQTESLVTPPSTPTLISPGSSSSPGPEISDMTPTLRWNSVAGATSYNFGVRDVDTGSLVVDVDGYTSTSYTTSSLTAGHKYRWNVQACNSAGCSSYSSYYYFQTESLVTPPSTPTLISPGSSSSPGPEISDMTPTLRWNSVAGATSYNFGVRDVDTGSLVVDVDGYTSTSYTTSSLTAGHKYRWNVQACNSAGCSSYSSYYYFQTESLVTPPSTPTLISPGSSSSPGPEISDMTPTLRWNSVAGATSYNFGVRDVDTGSLVVDVDGYTSTSYTTSSLTAGHKYRWNVQACNSAGCSSYSSYYYFQTESLVTPPSTPTLISPGSSSSPGPEISDMTPTLRWNSVAGATSYNFGVRDVDTGSLVVDVDGYTSTSYTTSSLTAGHKYRWNVQACNSAGCSSYSSYYYFQTATTAQSDLIIQNLSVTPNSGVVGSSPTVSFTIRNQGSGTANASTTNIRINTSSSNVTPSDYLLASISTPSIAAGSTYNVNRTVTIPGDRPLGTNYVWVIVDVNSTANQSNETNDKAYTTFTVTEGPAPPPIEVPYIRQAGDTPDDFEGCWACGATCAVMITAYYNRLPDNPIWVDKCGIHQSHYGAYVSRVLEPAYGYTFDRPTRMPTDDQCDTDEVPIGDYAYGAYGYIHHPDGLANPDYARGYFRKHGLFSVVNLDPSVNDVKSEIDGGHPVWASTNVWKGCGHIVVIKGYSATEYYIADPWPSGKTRCDYGSNEKYTWDEMGRCVNSDGSVVTGCKKKEDCINENKEWKPGPKWIVTTDPLTPGDTVRVLPTTDGIAVRSGPALSFPEVGPKLITGNVGRVVDDTFYGHFYNSGTGDINDYTWWKIKWDDGIEGWSAAAGDGSYGENWLEKISGPIADFMGSPTLEKVPLTVYFEDLSTGEITSWFWDFGDAGTSTEQNPTHIYNTPGTYTVSLTVTGPGGFDTEIKSDYITVNTEGWEPAYDTLFRHPSDLTLLRQYRDKSLNKTKKGRLYTRLLYKRSEKALQVLLQNPELMMEAKHLIEANKDAVSEVLNGYVGVIYNTDEIVSFLKAYARKSPPVLKLLAIVVEKEMLRKQSQGEKFLGFRLK